MKRFGKRGDIGDVIDAWVCEGGALEDDGYNGSKRGSLR